MLAPLNRQHPLGPAVGLHTLQPQHNLLRGLSLGGEEQSVSMNKTSTSGQIVTLRKSLLSALLKIQQLVLSVKKRVSTELGSLH